MKTVIFDFDGTIADTLPAILKLFNVHAKEFGFEKLSDKDVSSLADLTPFQILRKYGIKLIKLPFLANKVRVDLGRVIKKVPIFPAMKEVILSLNKKGYRLGILSSNSKRNVEEFLKLHGIFVFDFIHSEQNLLAKGNALKRLLKIYQISVSDTVYIGDEVRDIDASRKNGMRIISVAWGFNHRKILTENEPDFIADTPDDIIEAL